MKEYFGGLRGQYEMAVPAVLGIQAAEKTTPLRPGGQSAGGHENRQNPDH